MKIEKGRPAVTESAPAANKDTYQLAILAVFDTSPPVT
ncbi:Uncharacterised protein [Yersinia rohdei]|uniref:Uncharacterized protein n=1 Tax=Yersinia rohdei TaxID=29485 RepID=A0A0U1HX82_YERRO|nr:Uncharacterised protein [Yersinia rohdei]